MLIIEKKRHSLINPLYIKINEMQRIQVASVFELKLDEKPMICLLVKIFANPYILHKSGYSPIIVFFWNKNEDYFDFDCAEHNCIGNLETIDFVEQLIDYVQSTNLNVERVLVLYKNLFLSKYFEKNNVISDDDFVLNNIYDVDVFKAFVKSFSKDTVYDS